jgi:hypothetical protein
MTVIAIILALTALLGLGWSGSPVRLHAPSAGIWAAVAGALALVEFVRAPHDSDQRFFAATALCISAVALVEGLIVLLAFAPCGERCI